LPKYSIEADILERKVQRRECGTKKKQNRKKDMRLWRQSDCFHGSFERSDFFR